MGLEQGLKSLPVTNALAYSGGEKRFFGACGRLCESSITLPIHLGCETVRTKIN
jgi:hypothetical protein